MSRKQVRFLFLNAGHFLDHLFMLVFATAAALRLASEWDMSYAELVPYATPGFVAFGCCAVLAGWLADMWSREGMMVVFFTGIGASSILAGMADSPLEISASLTLVGVFAAIYHPVGLAMVVQEFEKTGVPLAINGIFGNMGVACAALLTGFFIDNAGWRSAFVVPGALSILLGLSYWLFLRGERGSGPGATEGGPTVPGSAPAPIDKNTLRRIFAVIMVTTAIGGLVFQSTTFALPKILDERLVDLGATATAVGWYAFIVFALASIAQLIVGYLVDNLSIRAVFASVALLQAVFFALMTQVAGAAALLVSIGFMFVVFGQIPINDVLVGRISRGEWRSRAYALRYLVTFSVMASAVPLIGWIHGEWGFDRLFVVLAVASSSIFLTVLLLPRSGTSRRQEVHPAIHVSNR